MVKSSAFAVIYLLASIMYCNLIWRNSYLFFAKITHVIFCGLRCTTRLSLHIGLSACIIPAKNYLIL